MSSYYKFEHLRSDRGANEFAILTSIFVLRTKIIIQYLIVEPHDKHTNIRIVAKTSHINHISRWHWREVYRDTTSQRPPEEIMSNRDVTRS